MNFENRFEYYLQLIDKDIQRLEELKDEIMKNFNPEDKPTLEHSEIQLPYSTKEPLKHESFSSIEELLIYLKIPPHIKGSKYLCDAIEFIRIDPDYLDLITKKLYPDIAKKHDTTASRVERAIRHAIEVSYCYLSDEQKQKFFGGYSLKEKPTNSAYIAYINSYINTMCNIQQEQKQSYTKRGI